MHSIRLRFLALLSLLLALLLLLLNTVPALLARDAVFHEKQRTLNARAAMLAAAISGLGRLNADGVAEALSFHDLREIDGLAVYDRDGRPLYGDGSVFRPEDLRTALGGRVVFRSRFTRGAFRSSVSMPLSGNNGLTGVLLLLEEDEAHAEAIRAVQEQIATLSVVIAAVALFSGFFFVQRMTKRLRALAASMRSVAAGDYRSRHSVTGEDEISALGTEFNALTARLERTETERQRFVADASHELKTPLATIRLLSDSILTNPDVDRNMMLEFVADIAEENSRLTRTTEKLLALSRLDSRESSAPELIDLAPMVRDALASMQPLAWEKQVSLAESLEDGCRLLGSRDDVDHILYNLIDNAVKYNVPGGEVRVTLRALDSELELAVEDTGIGIPEADLPYVFERFYRVDKARSREAGGSGLGLSIVHDAVLALGGSIRVEPNKPRGTRFVLRFPRVKA